MSKLKNINNILFFVCLFAVGLFNEYLACIASALMLLRLGFVAVKSGRFSFKLNFVTLTIFAVSLFYLLSSLWAVDSGMAVVGFFKFLPALIFLLILQQQGQTQQIFELLPLSAVFMTVLSAVLSFIPVIKEYFTVAGRLSGFFQYSNTYAVFVLLSLILLISKGLKVWYEWIFAALLLFGILYSGSRTVFLIMLIALPLAVLCTKSKKLIVGFFCLLALSVAGAALYVAISGNFDTVKSPDCENAGTLNEYCADCGEFVRVVNVPATHKHSLWSWIMAPAGGKEGVKTRSCADCGKTETVMALTLDNKGDINEDAQVNVKDLIGMKKIAAGLKGYLTVADMSGDNICTALDLVLLRKYILGIR